MRLDQKHQDTIAVALAGHDAARSSIVASWARSARKYGLDPGHRPKDDRLTQGELSGLRDEIAEVVQLAAPTLDRLFGMVSGFGACIVLANPQGVPLERRGKDSEDADFAASGLWIGTHWSEKAAGTNGIGTCLAEGRAVVIHREQHYLAANIGLSCASAPIHDPEGRMIAVLDVSTMRPEFTESFIALLSHSVIEAARRIEADLFHARYLKARIMLVPGIDKGHGALLAVDADELVIGATKAARLHLGLTGDLSRAPIPAADLLGLVSHDTPADGERAVIARAVARSGGNLSAAARALGLSRATLHRKLGRNA